MLRVLQLSSRSQTVSAQEVTPFHQLPGTEPGKSKNKLSHPTDQSQCKCGFSGNAKQSSDDDVPAFTHSKRPGNEAQRRLHSLPDAFQDKGFFKTRRSAEGVEANPDLSRTDYKRDHRNYATSSNCSDSRIDLSQSPI